MRYEKRSHTDKNLEEALYIQKGSIYCIYLNKKRDIVESHDRTLTFWNIQIVFTYLLIIICLFVPWCIHTYHDVLTKVIVIVTYFVVFPFLIKYCNKESSFCIQNNLQFLNFKSLL